MAPPKRTVFRDDWLLQPQFSGVITRAKSDNEAHCVLCKKSFQLSNMGIEALKSHVSGKKHIGNAKSVKQTGDIRLFTSSAAPGPSSASTSAAVDPDDPPTVAVENTTPAALPSRPPAGPTAGSDGTPSSGAQSALTSSRIASYCLGDDVSSAEIVWCLQAVENSVSLSASARQAALFERMFPDSIVAKKMELGASKVGYSITFGLGPYFFEQIVNEIRQADAFVVGFDESLNKKSQKLQMDICVSYWSLSTNEVVIRYFSSAFLGHSRARDLSEALQKHLDQFTITKLLQVSMDGPNVNFAAMRELKSDIQSIHGCDCPVFLNLGSCGLHTVNNCFKQGFKSVLWQLLDFFRSSYNVFKDVPARRNDYVRFSEESDPPFPAKFCAVRWLENVEVAANAIKCIPFLIKFVDGAEKEKIKIDSKSYSIVRNAVKEKLLPARIAFFSFVAHQLKPFLTDYQCSRPMIPFLYTDLSSVIKDIMGLFVKDKVLDSASSVADVDLSKEDNLLPVTQVKLGNATKAELRKVSVSTEEMKQFKTDCRKILVKMCQIVVDKSPLSKKYRIAKYVTFCDPALISSNLSGSKIRLGNAVQAFIANNWFTGSVGDQIELEFKQITSKTEFQTDCKSYVKKDQRIDHFWRLHLEGQKCYTNLFSFLKKVLILSHGQAFVERGFSVNKKLIVENQVAESLVAQRHVYDAIKAAGGVKSFEISKKMIVAYRLARRNHKEALQVQSRENAEQKMKAAEKRSLSQQLADLKAKKAKVASEKTAEISAIDDQISAMLNRLG